MVDFMSRVSSAASSARGTSVGAAVEEAALVRAAQYAADDPRMQVNRARGAALVDWGYAQMAWYERNQAAVFGASVAGCALGCYMAWRRRKVPEAMALYPAAAILCGVVAFLSRPASMRPEPAPVPIPPPDTAQALPTPSTPGGPPPAAAAPEPPPDVLQQVLGWLDRRVQARTQEQPGWEAGTWRRLANDLGYGTMSRPGQVLLLTNAL